MANSEKHGALTLFHEATRLWFEKTLGKPTAAQKEAWPAIAAGGHTLVSAPTGTGKTLSAFLVFIDRFLAQARAGALEDELHLIYISPLKALAGDIRENLRRPLNGLSEFNEVKTAIRTGDTTPYERQKMVKSPPHILITTPESLYLLLTSKSGKTMLQTAKIIILDELHAMIDSKRGAHLMLSLARLDKLCGKPLQRIGLSATVEPPEAAAEYLACSAPVTVVAPGMQKEIAISVTAPAENMHSLPHGTVWPELASAVYDRCQASRSVIAFTEGRRNAEKLAYYVNQQAGTQSAESAFAKTHHGCVSREQRFKAENDLRSGALRLLCATSSMELGIDVGDIDRVMQVGCPSTISGLMQRLGRAGHNPGRVSVMDIFPRTAAEGLACGLTARVALNGGIERLRPPRLCLDVLAQHLVSMASDGSYTIDDVMGLLSCAYPFREVTREDVTSVLEMLAGDYEHKRDLPVRPRILYDRVNGRVEGDSYSRMLAVSAGGVIPDTGMYAVKTESGVKLGELDEEFVGEARVGDSFLLGTFAWKIIKMDKEVVTVAQTSTAGVQPPFWKLPWLSRRLQTGLAFGSLLRKLNDTSKTGTVTGLLRAWTLDETMARHTAAFLSQQLESTGGLPDDRTVIVEHFANEMGETQIMVHSVFGKQVNVPLSLLIQEAVKRVFKMETYCYADDDGLLLTACFGGVLPEGLLTAIRPEEARPLLEALLPSTSLFNMAFRYNAGRALMMGVRKGKRQPLWVQRLRSAEMLDSVIHCENHPLIREAKRECLEDYWDLEGLEWLLDGVRSGQITVREVQTPFPSPMSLPLRRQAEADILYDYTPSSDKIKGAAQDMLEEMQKIKPAAEHLARLAERHRLPEDERQLHSLLMMEGDLIAGELELPAEWYESLAGQRRALYVEPGLWIAAEHSDEYGRLAEGGEDCANIVRRSLRYRGAQTAGQVSERYFLPADTVRETLSRLREAGSIVEDDGVYYHKDVYERARHETVAARRRQVRTVPPERYAAWMAGRSAVSATPDEQLRRAVASLSGLPLAPALWEGALFPARTGGYNAALLDALLARGEWFWQMSESGLAFYPTTDIDWDADPASVSEELKDDEKIIYEALLKRGASFSAPLAPLLPNRQSISDVTGSLMEKGHIRADSFLPVRQFIDRERMEKAPPKRRVAARVKTLTEGRWEVTRPLLALSVEQQLERVFDKFGVACRETVRMAGLPLIWAGALEFLRVREYTGQVRRGYFIEGLSGAQFVRASDYEGFLYALENPQKDVVWLSAADPFQPWGKVLRHGEGKEFTCLPGSVAALKAGEPVAVFERQGGTLRVFDSGALLEALEGFVEGYMKKRIYSNLRRLIVKQYPKEAAGALKEAGFMAMIPDFELYR
ncbi:MAG: DEAD/DEAH box helicase [Oscillospiraceae bacterium]|nr:DEAD/DEAH box helicase [Oscillospiraceae bacterium]